MDTTLHDQQYIIVNKAVFWHLDLNAPRRLLGAAAPERRELYPFHMPRRGDIVVLHAPDTELGGPRNYIKRVIGMPGETIQIMKGQVYINGEPLDEPYLDQSTDCDGANSLNPGLCQAYVIPAGSVVVMGDNRGNSEDSRSWHAAPAISLDRIVGKAWLSYWPTSTWGILHTPAYAQHP